MLEKTVSFCNRLLYDVVDSIYTSIEYSGNVENLIFVIIQILGK